ncbi:MAG: heme biosynthesis protein HemY [Paracoccaceae bacterium]
MLWSLIKIVIFVAIVAAAAFGASYLLDMGGGLVITIPGVVEYNLTPLKAVIALILLVLAIWLVLKIVSLLIAVLKFINGDETALTRYFDRNRESKGYKALADGLMALASGDGREAMAKAAKAEKYLHKPALTNLLTAQAAEMTGDTKKAETVYKRMLDDDATRFVGVRGIMKQKLANGDDATALQLAKKAHDMKPRHAETSDTLLRLQAQAQDWAGARRTLTSKLKHGTLPRDVHKRRDAVLALSEAKGVLDEGNDIDAREAAIEANRLSPDLIPAAAFAARGYIAQGKGSYAARVLKKAWAAQPHPDLAAAFAAIEPDETAQERLKRFQKLVKPNADHPESQMVMAELNIAAEDFPAARRALGDLLDNNPDARALTIMAAIERGEGKSDAVVKGWLARALSAPRGPQWVCDKCHAVHAEWEPVCANCSAFDTLAWVAPPASSVVTPTGVEMLPLIVGAIEDKSETAETGEATEPEVIDAEIIEDGPVVGTGESQLK